MLGTSAREGTTLTDTRLPGRVLISRPLTSERGSRGCSDHRGRACCPMPCSGQGPRLRLDREAGGWGSRRADSPGSGPPCVPPPTHTTTSGSGQEGPASRVGPDAAHGTARREDPERPAHPQLARAPDSPAWRRQDPGVAAAPGARPCPASRREAASRCCLLGPPCSAPPAHFPQEMINSGRGAFPWQPAPTRGGRRRRRRACVLPHTLTRALTLARGAFHPAGARAAPRLSPGCPGSLQPTHASACVYARPCHTCSCFRAHSHTRVHTSLARALVSTHEHIPTLVHTHILLHLNLCSLIRTSSNPSPKLSRALTS